MAELAKSQKNESPATVSLLNNAVLAIFHMPALHESG